MNAYEYLNALRRAFEVLPEDERESAIRYYEEYFLDAGPENEQQVIEELGAPEQVAQNIVNEYKEVARRAPSPDPAAEAEGAEAAPSAVPARPRSAWETLLVLLGGLVLLCFIGIPVLGGLLAGAVGLAVGAVALLAGLGLMLVFVLAALPVAAVVAGVVLCAFSLALFFGGRAASGLLTLGAGVCLLALGCMMGFGCVRLCAACIPPLMRGVGWCVEQCGRFFRWCARLARQAWERLRGW